MGDYLNLGPVPAEETCAQVGEENYETRARAECQRYIALLRKKFGPEPEGSKLKVRGFNHDFGRYYEVIVTYRDNDQAAFDYALRLEEEAPERWDEDGTRHDGGTDPREREGEPEAGSGAC